MQNLHFFFSFLENEAKREYNNASFIIFARRQKKQQQILFFILSSVRFECSLRMFASNVRFEGDHDERRREKNIYINKFIKKLCKLRQCLPLFLRFEARERARESIFIKKISAKIFHFFFSSSNAIRNFAQKTEKERTLNNNFFSFSFFTVDVVDLEKEFNFIVGWFPCELVHGIDEFLKTDAPVVVFVENVKDSLHEKGLEIKKKYIYIYILVFEEKKIWLFEILCDIWKNGLKILFEKILFEKMVCKMIFEKNSLKINFEKWSEKMVLKK